MGSGTATFAFADRALRHDDLVNGSLAGLGASWVDVKRSCASYVRAALR